MKRASTFFLGLAAWTIAVAPALAQAVQPSAKAACGPQKAAPATVKSVTGGRSLLLEDGREILLAAIETPGPWARDALPALIAGQALAVEPLSGAADRYGRIPSRVFLPRDGAVRSLEAELVARGAAMVGISGATTRNGIDPCRSALLAAEIAARAARLGLWSDPDYDTKAADNLAVILASRGRFAIVEGKVLSVRESGGTIYVNFGRRWSEDFTVTILKRISARFTAAGLEPKRLEGRRVRVRGFVEERGGPWIEATAPEQFEIAESR
jgi:endonuclease YncB( thermonuclease family)